MSGRRVWLSADPLANGTALGLIGTGPVTILAGFSLAAVISLTSKSPRNSWHDVAAVFFALAVVLLLATLRLIIAAQYHLASPADRLSWRPEAGQDDKALEEERKAQWRDFYKYLLYRERAVKVFPCGIASALFGLGSASVGDLAHGGLWVVAAMGTILGIGGVVALLELWDRPRWLFPSSGVALEAMRRRFERQKCKSEELKGVTDPFLPSALPTDVLDFMLRDHVGTHSGGSGTGAAAVNSADGVSQAATPPAET